MDKNVNSIYDLQRKNLIYTSIIFEVISQSILLLLIVQLYNHNTNSLPCLLIGGILTFFCTMSMIGDKNKNDIMEIWG